MRGTELVINYASGNVSSWTDIHNKIAAKLPAQADEITLRIKIDFYRGKKDWTAFEPVMLAYMKDYGATMTDGELNSIAWLAFANCSDMTCVSGILDWSKRLKESNEPGLMDTYANILYKMGKKDDAIAMEEKAIGLADPATKASLQPTLDKMKKGEKTWD